VVTTFDPARRAAVDVVLAVDERDAYSNLLLPSLLRERSISGTDAAFATELTYGTLRRAGVLDVVVGHCARRPATDLDPAVRAVLRLGSYQLLHTRIPPHAAVSTTVELCREVAGHRPSGLVNAVLRRVAERDWADWVDQLAAHDDPVGRLAFERGYPQWIATALLDSLDGDVAELERALVDERPVTHLVARPGRIDRDDLIRMAGPGASTGPWSPYAVRLGGGDPRAIDAVRDGRAGVQDEGSQLVAIVLAAAELAGGGDTRWLDACAGPGGKAALLSGLRPPGTRLLAADRAEHRTRMVDGALAGAAGALAVVADAIRPSWPAAGFDRVLVDVPCSGLGALRRRPEMRWRRRPEDIARLAGLQRDLLRTALDAARTGGIVGYATCSPHRAETTEVVADVLADRVDVEVVDARAMLPDVPDLGPGPGIQLYPHRHGTDAMFVAVLRRTLPAPPRVASDIP
jgi:16S rRNA (cytosine967-C5)-methyltransferase